MENNDQIDLCQLQLSMQARKNWHRWQSGSDEYEQLHAIDLAGEKAMSWGIWCIPEAELHILGDVAGKDILELGCGAARWSIALAQQGAHPVGLDFAPQQLQHAHWLMQEANVVFPLIEASAEAVPLPDESFDIIFSDWGAMTFADPYHTVPEAARLLRPGGLLAFATASPIQIVCQNLQRNQLTNKLINDYFSLHFVERGDEVHFQLSYGQWICLFHQYHLLVNDLIETKPPAGVVSTYCNAMETEWARHWPMENIWRLRKQE